MIMNLSSRDVRILSAHDADLWLHGPERALDVLVQLGLARRERQGNTVRWRITPAGVFIVKTVKKCKHNYPQGVTEAGRCRICDRHVPQEGETSREGDKIRTSTAV